jgi:NADH:ubiquinone reductase (H+-translocating)
MHRDMRVTSAVDGHVVLSTGEELDSELIVGTAGTADLPLDERGYVVVRVGTDGQLF